MLVVVVAIAVGIAATAAFIGKVAAQRERRFVHNSHRIGMELQNGRGNLGGHGAEESIAHDLRLVFAAHHDEHLLGGHDGTNAHGVCLAGHFVGGIEQAAVRVNGGFRKVDAVGFLREFGRGLVEADVAVVAQTQKLQVNAAGKQDGSLIEPCFLA